jgi:hypothetical protein
MYSALARMCGALVIYVCTIQQKVKLMISGGTFL